MKHVVRGVLGGFSLGFALACSGLPGGVGGEPPPPEAPPVAIPAELAGEWYAPRAVDGRWVVERPCPDAQLTFADVDGKASIAMKALGAEDDTNPLVEVKATDDGYVLLHQNAPEQSPDTQEVHWLGADHTRFTDPAHTWLRKDELDRLEVVLSPAPDASCGARIEGFDDAKVLGDGVKLLGWVIEDAEWVLSDRSLTVDLKAKPPTLAYVDADGKDQKVVLQGALALGGTAFVLGGHPADAEGKALGIGFFPAAAVPAPLEPALPGPDGATPAAEAEHPKAAPPTGAWFVRLPGLADWRAVAWAVEGAEPPEGKAGKGKAGKGKAGKGKAGKGKSQ